MPTAVSRRCVPQPIRTFFAAGAPNWRMALARREGRTCRRGSPRHATRQLDWLPVAPANPTGDVRDDLFRPRRDDRRAGIAGGVIARIWLGQFRVIRCTEPRLRTGCIVERRFHRPVEILLYQPRRRVCSGTSSQKYLEPFPPDGHMADLVLVDYLQSGDGSGSPTSSRLLIIRGVTSRPRASSTSGTTARRASRSSAVSCAACHNPSCAGRSP